MFEKSFLEEVKSKVDLRELVGEYTNLKPTGSLTYMGRCPHPSHRDSTASFCVYKKNSNDKYFLWHCKGKCGTGGDCYRFYMWIENTSFVKSVIALCNKYNIPIPKSSYDELYNKNIRLTNSYIVNLKSNQKAIKYLYNRGLNDKDIEKWKIGYVHKPLTVKDKNNKKIDTIFDVSGKIIFPLLSTTGITIAFNERWIEKPEGRNDKYKNSSESLIFSKSAYFYGLHNIDRECDEFRITEGPMDVIMADKFGVKNIFATLGTSFTDKHIEIIKSYNKTPVFIMDGDEAGINAVERAAYKLAEHDMYCKVLILPTNKDLCDMSLKYKFDMEKYINMNAITYGQYKANKIFDSYDSHTTELKIKYLKEIDNLLNAIPYEYEKKIIKSNINKRFNL